MSEQSNHQLKRDIAAMKELAESRGWAVMLQGIEDELKIMTRQLGADPNMEDRAMHFYCGAIYAMDRFLVLPERIQQTIANHLTLASATAGKSEENNQ